MTTVTATYAIKYELEFAPHYVWLSNDLCYNLKTGRFVRQVLVGGCIGYCIDGRFRSLTAAGEAEKGGVSVLGDANF